MPPPARIGVEHERRNKMKKYVKPELFYESFELSQHIAGCSLTITNSVDVLTCAANGTITDGFGGMESSAWFVEANTNCTSKSEVYCYTNGSITSATVNS